jgi:hypothetical protein
MWKRSLKPELNHLEMESFKLEVIKLVPVDTSVFLVVVIQKNLTRPATFSMGHYETDETAVNLISKLLLNEIVSEI